MSMSSAEIVHDIVVGALAPARLDVINESHQHNVPPGSETHFKLVIVSDAFEGKTLVNRHRIVNRLLAEQLSAGIHALGLHTYTPSEWQAKGGRVPDSPPCLGGKASQAG